jgi:hypothetical protein
MIPYKIEGCIMAEVVTKYDPRQTLKLIDSLINKNDYVERLTEYNPDKRENAMPYSRELGEVTITLMTAIQQEYYNFCSQIDISVSAFSVSLLSAVKEVSDEIVNTNDYAKLLNQLLKIQNVVGEVNIDLANLRDEIDIEKNDVLINMYNDLSTVKHLISASDTGEAEISKIKVCEENTLKSSKDSISKIQNKLKTELNNITNKVMSVRQSVWIHGIMSKIFSSIDQADKEFSNIDKLR